MLQLRFVVRLCGFGSVLGNSFTFAPYGLRFTDLRPALAGYHAYRQGNLSIEHNFRQQAARGADLGGING